MEHNLHKRSYKKRQELPAFDKKGKRRCSVCKTDKTKKEFNTYLARNGVRKPKRICKLCCDTAYKNHYRDNIETFHSRQKQQRLDPEYRKKAREYKLKRVYGLTVSEYDVIFKNQNSKCAICGEELKIKNNRRKFVIDHSHKTGKVRGLLCFPCNTSLAFLKENKQSFLNAIKYLEKYDNF